MQKFGVTEVLRRLPIQVSPVSYFPYIFLYFEPSKGSSAEGEWTFTSKCTNLSILEEQGTYKSLSACSMCSDILDMVLAKWELKPGEICLGKVENRRSIGWSPLRWSDQFTQAFRTSVSSLSTQCRTANSARTLFTKLIGVGVTILGNERSTQEEVIYSNSNCILSTLFPPLPVHVIFHKRYDKIVGSQVHIGTYLFTLKCCTIWFEVS